MNTTISFNRNLEEVMFKRLLARHKARFERLHYFNNDQQFDPVWQKTAAGAVQNFVQWFDSQAKLQSKEYQHKTNALLVTRVDAKLPFGPGNCKLITRGEFRRQLQPTPITNVLKTAVKEFVNENPFLTRKAVADHFKPYSYQVIRSIINDLKKNAK